MVKSCLNYFLDRMELLATEDDTCTSSDTLDLLCDLCAEDNRQTTATGYCTTCDDNLCHACIKAHSKNKGSKCHKVVGDSGGNRKSKKIKKIKCTEHVTEEIKFYCQTHDSVLCANCVTHSHKQCKIEHIRDKLDDFKQAQGHRKATQAVDQFETAVEQCKRTIQAKQKTSEQIVSNAEEDILKFRKDFCDFVDKEKERIIAKVDNLHIANKTQLESLVTECDLFLEKVVQSKARSEKYELKPFEQFVQAKITNKEVQKMQSVLETVDTQNYLSYYSFIPKDFLRQMLTGNSSVGEVKKSVLMGRRLTFDIDLSVATADDKVNCCIMGCDLLEPDLLILTDFTNKAVKVVNVKLQSVTMVMSFNNVVCDITAISHDQAAVTIPERNIVQFLLVRRKIAKGRHIKVTGECHGIHHYDNQLFLTYPTSSPPKIEILTMNGEMVHIFRWNEQEVELFKWPNYITVADGTIFVSDTNKQQIIKLSMTGEVINRYEDKELGGPGGITCTGDGYLLVCSNFWQRYNVQIISTDCRKIGTLLDDNNGLKQPFCVQLCQSTKTVFVGCKYSENEMGGVKMFNYS